MSTPSTGSALTAPLRELGRAGIFLLTVMARLRLGRAQLGELLLLAYFAGLRKADLLRVVGCGVHRSCPVAVSRAGPGFGGPVVSRAGRNVHYRRNRPDARHRAA